MLIDNDLAPKGMRKGERSVKPQSAISHLHNIPCKIFGFVGHVPKNIILAPRNEQVLSATCSLIAFSITQQETHQAWDQSLVPNWCHIVDQGLRHRGSSAQEAAASAMASMSSLMDCSTLVQR